MEEIKLDELSNEQKDEVAALLRRVTDSLAVESSSTGPGKLATSQLQMVQLMHKKAQTLLKSLSILDTENTTSGETQMCDFDEGDKTIGLDILGLLSDQKNYQMDLGNTATNNFTVTHANSDPFIAFIKTEFCQSPERDGVECVIKSISMTEDEDDIVAAYMLELQEAGKGFFSRRHVNKTTTQYLCERAGKPKGKKTLPTETRANNCPAYVSFKFVVHLGKKAVIVRHKLEHEGHSIHDQYERHVSRPDPALVAYIESLVDQGKKPMDIIVKAWTWAKQHGKYDFHDRRYYLTSADVVNICQSYRLRHRYHKDDAAAVHELCTNVLKSEIVHYQALTDDQPLIIVYQNNAQCERMRHLARNVVFLDATYKGVTGYGYAFYTLVARNGQGRGTPLAYCISSQDSSVPVQVFLQSLKERVQEFAPRSFMTDKDMKEISAIRAVFPSSHILLCWFHVLQAVYRFLNKRESGISGNQQAQTRKQVIDYVRKMKSCTKKDEFEDLAAQLDVKMPSLAVAKYLKEHWCSKDCSEMWSNYGRTFFHEDQDTNNLVERFFLGIKYNFLGGYGNQRIEDLLLLLHGNVADYYDYMEELAKTNRLKNKRTVMETRGRIVAENMLRGGYDRKIVWENNTVCSMPSQTEDGKVYRVDIAKLSCECPGSSQGGMCKHIHLCLLIAAQRDIDVAQERGQRVEIVLQESTYSFDANASQVEVFDRLSGDVTVVNTNTFTCSCQAFSHGIECICVQVARVVAPLPLNPNRSTHDHDDHAQHGDDSIQPSLNEQIKFKLDEIQIFINSEQFDTVSQEHRKSILTSITQLHQVIQRKKFKKVCRKRKQHPLHPYRKSKSKGEHAYCIPRPTSRRQKKSLGIHVSKYEDGRFKRSGRKKGIARNPFQ